MDDRTTEAHSQPSATRQQVIFLVPDSKETNDHQYAQDILAEHAVNFRALGADVHSMPWSAPIPADQSSTIYVANLVWGYHLAPDRWFERLRTWPNGVRLVNSASLLLWNSRKTYLNDLEAAGVPIIPTVFVDHVNESTLIEAAERFKTDDLIVKPQVSASSFSTLRVLVGRNDFDSAPKSISVEAVLRQLQQVCLAIPMMIQPFMKNINAEGEISVLVFGGKVSHAVLKTNPGDDFRVQYEYGGQYTLIKTPSAEILNLVTRAIAACPELPRYARVDMVRNDTTGILSISELELIEPEFFLGYETSAGMAFARAILDRNV